jgi:hypothetical protein
MKAYSLYSRLLIVLVFFGCAQNQRLQWQRGWEHLHTPSSQRSNAGQEAHAARAAAQPQPSCDNAKIKAYNHQVCCTKVTDLVAPSSVDELREIMRTRKGPVRVVGNSHTSNEQICTDGVGISMANFSTIHGLKHWRGVEYVEVDPGVRLSDLNRWLYDNGRSIGYTVIGFRGITVGGGIATGVHGSSLQHPSVLSARVEYIEIMDASGEIARYHRPERPRPEMRTVAVNQGQLASTAPTAVARPAPEAPLRSVEERIDEDRFRALAASVGMLGIVTRIGLRTEPRFNLDVTVDFHPARVLWTDGVEKLVGKCDWGQLVWLPRASRVMRVCGMRTQNAPDAGAQNSLLEPHADATAIASFKELMEDTIANGAYLCTIEKERFDQLKWYPPFVRQCCCKTKYTTHAVGPSDLMMSSELTEHQEALGEIDYEIALPLAQVPAALTYVYRKAKDERLCMPLIGAFLRFSPVDDSTLIAHSVTDRRWFRNQKVMFLEFVVYVLHEGETEEERQKQETEYYAKYRQLAADLVMRFHGRPHWAKNQVRVFQVHKEEDKLYQARLREFHCFVRAADPEHRFANEFTKVVGLTPPEATHADGESLQECVRRAVSAEAPPAH